MNVGKDVVFLVHTIPWGVNNEVCQENEVRESGKWDVSECKDVDVILVYIKPWRASDEVSQTNAV